MAAAKKTTRKTTRTPKVQRNIVGVVFDFDVETLQPRPGATEYTYFFTGRVKVGEVAMVLSPRTGSFAGVLVTSMAPSAQAIRRATKSLVGIVDLSVYRVARTHNRTEAVKQAWERYDGGI